MDRKLITAAVAAALALATPALHAQTPAGAPPDQRASSQQIAGQALASRLLDMAVRNPQGETLGEIEDLVIDTRTREVRYAVLEFERALGLGDKLFIYPINAFTPDPQRDALVLNVERERLAQSPGVDRDRFPDADDRSVWDRIDRLFGGVWQQQRSQAQGEDTNADAYPTRQRVSNLIDRDVRTASGDDVGEVDDLLINMRDRRIEQVIIEFDRAWNPTDKQVALALTEFDTVRRGEPLVVRRSREQLREAPAFDSANFRQQAGAAHRQRVGRVTEAAVNPATPVLLDSAGVAQLDRDGDGRLSAGEASADAMVQQQFSQIDRDGNGALDAREIEQYRQTQPSQDPAAAIAR